MFLKNIKQESIKIIVKTRDRTHNITIRTTKIEGENVGKGV